MAVVIETLASHGQTSRSSRIPLRAGTLRLNVRPGDVFRLVDEETGKAPVDVTVKRQDTSILVEAPGQAPEGSDAAVELIGFYSSCSVSAPCHLNLPDGEEGAIDITPATSPIGALSDGSFVLHDPGYRAAPVAGTSEGGWTENKPLMYGVGAAAVVGLVAAAASGGSGDATGSTIPPVADTTTPPVNGGTGTVTDPALSVTQSSVGTKRAPILAGTGTPGSQITIEIDTDGDSKGDVSYQSTVGADGKWEADLSTLKPTSGALPTGGLTADSSVQVSQTGATGTTVLPVFKLTADDTPPAQPTLAAVATDNIINQAEATQPVKVSGTGEAGSLIELSWGKATYDTTVGPDGNWSVEVPATAIANSGSVALSVTASDYAGNTTTPVTQTVSIDRTPPAAPVIQATGGTDNYVSAAELAAGTTISGTAEAGSSVKVDVGASSQTVQADTSGKWQAAFTPAQLPTADGQYEVTASATDKAGNASTTNATAALVIDSKPPVLDDIQVGTNNVVRSGASFTVTGEAEGGSKVIIDYIYTSGSRQVVTQQFTVPGQGDEVDWTSPAFTAARVNTAQIHSLYISATDAAGNVSTTALAFEVRPTLGALRSFDSDDQDSPSEDAPSVLSPRDLLETSTTIGLNSTSSSLSPATQSSSLATTAGSTTQSSLISTSAPATVAALSPLEENHGQLYS
ncbi:MAG: Ig-like domain-containing protein [Lautropia sp.]|nr:Ig-like domain-containing protein [Lautropia sp.]